MAYHGLPCNIAKYHGVPCDYMVGGREREMGMRERGGGWGGETEVRTKRRRERNVEERGERGRGERGRERGGGIKQIGERGERGGER